jgi:hypothetical protein
LDDIGFRMDSLTWGCLIRFLDKWGCEPLQHLVLEAVRSAVSAKTIYPLSAFYLGASARADDICVSVLRQEWHGFWAYADPWWADNNSANIYPFDSALWAADFVEGAARLMPRPYFSALLQSTRHLRTKMYDSHSKEVAAQVFLKLLKNK